MTDQAANFTDIIKQSIDDEQDITIIGGGSKQFLGRSTALSNNIIKTTEHTGILTYEPVELVMQARAGTTLAEIENTLAEKGQCLSSEPALFNGTATLGGSVACNMSGPSRPWSGSLRDHILGVSLINGEGLHLKFGGQVMKNVAGYDISRLQSGAMGTLGLITDVSFKVMPKWKYEQSFIHECDISEAQAICNQIASSEMPILSASWFNNTLALRFATMENAIEKSVKNIPGKTLPVVDAKKFWQNIREYEHQFFTLKENEQMWRISVKSSAPFPKDVEGDWAFDWCGALRWIKSTSPNIEKLAAWAKRYNAQYYHWTGGDKSGNLNPSMPAELKKIHKKIKNSIDPHGLFNKGRLYEWM